MPLYQLTRWPVLVLVCWPPGPFAVGAPLRTGFWFEGMVFFLLWTGEDCPIWNGVAVLTDTGWLSSLERGGCLHWSGLAALTGTGWLSSLERGGCLHWNGVAVLSGAGWLSSLERGGYPLWNEVAVLSGTRRIVLSGLGPCLGRCPGGGGLVSGLVVF